LQCPELKGNEPIDTLSKQKSWWQAFSSDEQDQLATSSYRREPLLATEVQNTTSTPPSTSVCK
jgi:hypothetical protein